MALGNLLFWVLAAIVTAVACAAILAPMFRHRREGPEYVGNLRFYRAQIEELGRDLERGLISQDQHAVAEAEIGRRILARENSKTPDGDVPAERLATAPRWSAAAIAMAVPVGAVCLYLLVGNPDMPSQPFANRTDQAGQEYQAMVQLVEQLEQRLEAMPEDADTVIALAEVRGRMEQFGAAADLYGRAATLIDDDPNLKSSLLAAFAEMSILADDGAIADRPRAAIEESLRLNPREPRARYYAGLVYVEAGDTESALRVWRSLASESVADAPWLPNLRQRIAELESRLADGSIAARSAPPLSDDSIAEMAELSPEVQAARIGEMVEGLRARLEESPDDFDGWIRLARAYEVMGRGEDAAAALDRAAEQAKDDPASLDAVLAGLISLDRAANDLSPRAVSVAGQLYAADPTHKGALWVLASAARSSGDTSAARGFVKLLLEQIPEGSPERGEILELLESLAG